MKAKYFLITILALLPNIYITAYYDYEDGIYYDIIGSNAIVTYKTESDRGYKGSVTIPSTVVYNRVTYNVTSIGSSAFYGCSGLTSVTIPESVTSIGQAAFYGCSGLTSITIPNSVTSIGSSAFYGCSGLTSVTIPNSVTNIGHDAFSDCSGLKSVTIGSSVTSIGYSAFFCCDGLKRAEFASIESLCNISFGSEYANPLYFAHNLYIDGKKITNLVIPEDFTDIRKYAFAGCSLNSLIIGANVKTIGDLAFTGDSIKKVIWLPEVLPSGNLQCAIGKINYYSSSNYSSIAKKNFYYYPLLTSRFEVDGVIYVPLSISECDIIDYNYNSNLVSSKIGPTITYKTRTLNVRNVMPYACYNDTCLSGKLTVSNQGYIGKYAFYGCNQVTSGEISNDGTIEEHAFSYCTKLGNLSVTNNGDIDQFAFCGSEMLEELSVANNGIIGQYAFYGSKITKKANIANKGLIDSYAFSHISGDAHFIINNTGSLKHRAFFGSDMNTVSIDNNVTSIGVECFADDQIRNAASINNNGNIADSAFLSISCPQPTGFQAIINNTGSLGSHAFSKSRMSLVSISSKVNSIGSYCFADGSITYRATIENHGDVGIGAFSNIKGGFDAYIRSSGPLPQSCFRNSKMGMVEIGNGVTSIGDSCFQSTTFTQATIGNKVDSIGKYSFAGATGFTNIILPNNVKFMGECSFKDCTTMKNITVSRGLNEIRNGVFSGCSSLTSLFVPNTIETIRDEVFNDCSSLRILTLEDKNGEYRLGRGRYQGAWGNLVFDPLFKTCALDSVYVGGRLIYEVEQSPYSPFISHKTLRAIRFTDIKQEIYPKEFQDCTNLQNVYMGATMNPIGKYAFSGCTSLARFNVGPAVKRLGSYSFEKCSALKYIDLAYTDSICNNAFMNCTSLPEISIPPSTILIQNQVFKGCTALTNLYIKDRTSPLFLGINEWYKSYKGISGAGIPIFSDCPLDSVYIGGPITYSSAKASGYSPFFYNESLRSVYITNEEKTVYENEFYNCLGLQNLKLGPGVTTIKQYGFQSCKGLRYFEFASTLQTIGANAFSDCSNMKTIISHASTPPVCGEQALQDIDFWKCQVYVPEEAVDAYEKADQWKNFFIEKLKPIISFADANVKSLCVANWDTDGDGELDEDEAAAVTDLGEVFKNNTTITSFDELQYFTGLTEIGGHAFSGCTGLKSVTIPNSLTSIKAYAFSGCTDLTSISIPEGVTSIGENPFAQCTSLESIIVAPGNTVYDSRENCNAIIETATNTLVAGCKNTLIPNSVTTIGFGAFYNCTGIMSIAIPNSVTSIDRYAFYCCTGFTSITIPNSVTSIGSNAFFGCTGLTSVAIGNHVTSIGDLAFQGCSGLTSVTCLAENVPTTGSSVFYNVPLSDATLYVPKSSVNAYKTAEQWKSFGTIMTTDDIPDATSIALNKTETTLEAGAQEQLTATVLPAEAAQAVTWKSSDLTVATVDENGLVTAVAEGVATITATTTDGTDLDATCAVTVTSQRIYIETDVTSQFPIDWEGWNGATGYVGWAAPQVTTNDGRQTPACERFDGSQATTGIVFNRTLTGLTNGTYRIELYGAAASTKSRDTNLDTDMTADDESDETAVYLYAKTASGTVKQYIPAHWALDFNTSGIATAVLNEVVVTDGTVEIGMFSEKKYTNWEVVQIKGVTALVDAEEFHANTLSKAQTALADEAYANVTGEERAALSQAIADNTTVSERTAEAYQAAITTLETATKTFTDAKASYDAWAGIKNRKFPYASRAKKAVAESAAAVLPTNAADAVSRAETLLPLYRQYAESSAMLEGVDGATNMTSYINNPKAEEDVEGWTTVLGEGSGGSISIRNDQPWTDGRGSTSHKYFDGGNYGTTGWDVAFKQDITLPAGHYQLTAMGRSAQDVTLTLFAGDETAEMAHINADGGLFNLGWEQTSVEFELTESATVSIGVRGVTPAYHNWMSFSDFRLVQFPENVNVEGDIDGDGEIDVADIQHIINMIVGTEGSTSMADINGDGDVDIADIQAIINIIISNANAGAREMIPVSSQEEVPNADFVKYEQANNTIDVSLINDLTYSAFQLKVTLPKDVDITAVDFSYARMGELSKYVKKVTDGQYIIMGYSLDGSTIEGSEDVILTIQTSIPAQQDLAITDVVFSTPSAVAHKLPVVGGEETGVKDIVTSSMKVVGNTVFIYNSGSDTLLYIYSLSGSLVDKQVLHNGLNSFVLPKGQYVINKQKIFIGK